MANAPLSISEKSAMLALMMFGGKASNPEIRDAYGFVIEKSVRDSLVKQDLIKADQSKAHHNAYVHELTKDGWRRCHEQLADTMPSGGQKKDKILYGLARWIGSVMDQMKVTFAAIYPHVDAAKPQVIPPSTVDERILGAYGHLATEPGDWVGFAELRAALPETPRTEFDNALHRLAELPLVYHTPEVAQKTLSEADRRAAVHIGGEDKHFLSVKGI
jgi:hypothetical protein